ncbi:MAG: shikimate kinase [Nitrospirae bacterium]|nr:shikimate kinase [Nitrospirota bacterium]
MKNITLVGFMGTGKTTIGRILAKKLGFRFVDSDDAIEFDQGMSVSDIFAVYGEKYFRSVEKDVIQRLAVQDGQVISAGGGAVIDPGNVENMKKAGPVICLTAPPEVILKRVERHTHRPLLQVPDPLAKIKELLDTRAPFYAKADVTIDTSGMTPEEVATEILKKVGARD